MRSQGKLFTILFMQVLVFGTWSVHAQKKPLVSPPSPPATSASSPCTNAFTALLPCMSYVTGSNSTASITCCNGFMAVVLNNLAPCICKFVSPQNPLGIVINSTQALTLPAACKINTSPLAAQCSAMGFPLTPSPPLGELPLTPSTPGVLPKPSPFGTALSPGVLPKPSPFTTASSPAISPLGSPLPQVGMPLGAPSGNPFPVGSSPPNPLNSQSPSANPLTSASPLGSPPLFGSPSGIPTGVAGSPLASRGVNGGGSGVGSVGSGTSTSSGALRKAVSFGGLGGLLWGAVVFGF